MSFTKKSTFAPCPATTRGQAIHLGPDPKGIHFLYTNGRSVIIRNLAHPEIAEEYTGHSCPATVARYSPSGFYIASGDVQGNIRIWDTTNPEHITKTETKAFSGRINDIAWDFESKRLVAVGEGKDRFGHAFLFDTASSVGEISGHSKVINSVSLRPSRPFRAVTGSDDLTVNFYHGVPFKFNKSISDHTRFVQCVRYSPNGEFFVTSSSDGKIFLYDGKEGNKISELTAAENSHTGGVYSLSWSPDSTSLLSASGDMTCKLWDIKSQNVIQTWGFSDSPTTDDQQVGSLWQGSFLLSLSLSGDFNYLDTKTSRPVKVVKGHQKAITALTVTGSASDPSKTLYTGSYDGRVYAWNEGNGSGIPIAGTGHTNQVVSLASTGTDRVYSAGMDDLLKSIDTKSKSFLSVQVPSGAIPKSLGAFEDVAVIITGANEIVVSKAGNKVGAVGVKYTPTAVTLSPEGSSVAVGSEDGKVYLYTLNAASPSSLLTQKQLLESNRGTVTALAFSPKGDMLAVADTNRQILVYDTKSWDLKLHQWVFHTAKINSIAWSPDGLHAVSGGLDTNVEVWSVEKPMKHIGIKGAHLEAVNEVAFLDNDTIVSAGQDAFIKTWSLKHF